MNRPFSLNIFLIAFSFFPLLMQAQPILETGGAKMPDEWIDKDTKHRVVRLVRKEGSNASFYFHNQPFYKNLMVFYSTDKTHGRQIYTVDLKTYKIEQITRQHLPMNGELVGQKQVMFITRFATAYFPPISLPVRPNFFLYFPQITRGIFPPSMLMKLY